MAITGLLGAAVHVPSTLRSFATDAPTGMRREASLVARRGAGLGSEAHPSPGLATTDRRHGLQGEGKRFVAARDVTTAGAALPVEFSDSPHLIVYPRVTQVTHFSALRVW